MCDRKVSDNNNQDRSHFFAIAGRVMRRYLIDRARRRPPHVDLVPMDSIPEGLPGRSRSDLILQLDALLSKLESENPQWCKVIELKVFLGLTDEEAAQALQMSLHTLQRQWYRARHWLYDQLETKPSEPNKKPRWHRKRSTPPKQGSRWWSRSRVSKERPLS